MDRAVMFRQDIRFACAADGVRIAWAQSGAGYPLVHVAHCFSHLEQDASAPILRAWFARLAERSRLVRYDARGCGLSDRATGELSIETFVRDLEAVADAARLDRFALLGVSSGSAIAIRYAARHPERVSHLALVGACARAEHSAEARRKWDALVTLVELGWADADPTAAQILLAQSFPNATLEQLRALAALQRHAVSPATAARILRAIMAFDVSEDLPRVRAATIVLHARADRCVPLEAGRDVAAAIPDARFATLDSHNHAPLEGEPAFAQCLDVLARFLPASVSHQRFGALTPRERQILELVAAGLGNAEIASHLALSGKTVRNNITHIFDKLGAASRAQAIVLARAAGFAAAVEAQ